MRLHIAFLLAASSTDAFTHPPPGRPGASSRALPARRATVPAVALGMSAEAAAAAVAASSADAAEDPVLSTEGRGAMPEVEFPPILEELRDVAMRLHTREQAPREGRAEAPARPAVPHVPTAADYLRFLVDSNAVYEALEDVVDENGVLAPFRSSGLERTVELEKDIAWMCNEFDLDRPGVGAAGGNYAEELRAMVKGDGDVPEFMCHYYNFYFAHLAGGRMIGKQMSKLLLDGETLEFYKWGGDVNELKAKVKGQIEELARDWTRDERDKCINATAAAFKGGGAINGYLYGGSPH